MVALILAGIAIWAFMGSMVPYTHEFSKAKSGSFLQVYGKVDKSSICDSEFIISDESGLRMKVHSKKTFPQNLSHADFCVVTGTFSKKNDWFEAESVLVKCPSKYEEKTQPKDLR
ncbi:MAG: cytochrome c maturation protein CcmE [Caldiserica bacterium]|nr:cytochrome c maturation protein CcmE [Caldisericota bacterium]